MHQANRWKERQWRYRDFKQYILSLNASKSGKIAKRYNEKEKKKKYNIADISEDLA